MKATYLLAGACLAVAGTVQAQPATFAAQLQAALTTGGESLAAGDFGAAAGSLVGADGLVQGSAAESLNHSLVGLAEQDPEAVQAGVEDLAASLQAEGGPLDQLTGGLPPGGLEGGGLSPDALADLLPEQAGLPGL